MTRTTPRPASENRLGGLGAWPRVAAGITAAVVLAVVLVVVLRDGDDDPAAGARGAGAEMEHVHGVGVDQDGVLYAGSHYGLFRINEDGTAARVSEVQDFMGFTSAGAKASRRSVRPRWV